MTSQEGPGHDREQPHRPVHRIRPAISCRDPEAARCTDTAASAVIEVGLRCRVDDPNGATVCTDMPTSVGGESTAPSPGWLLRAGQASCEATLIMMRAAELGIPLQRVEVVVDSESHDRGILAMDDDVPAGPLSSRTRVRITANGVEPQVLHELVEWADRATARLLTPCAVSCR
jgi:uncharacterized OsmC-like protein